MIVHFSKLALVAFFATAVASESFAAIYYVAPTGSDSNTGSEDSPFATITKALSLLNNQGGHTIYMRGGTYNYNSRVTFQSSRTGTSLNPNNLLAYPGETPILDFSTMPESLAGQSAGRGLQFDQGANWWNVKGLTIQRARDNGLYNGGSNSNFEQIITRENQDSGFQLHDSASNNLILNCDSYFNYDPQTVGSNGPTPGENADGFAVKDSAVGPGNIFRGNRAWGNSDDGYDVYYTVNYGVLVQDCWAFDNGINVWGISNYAGDGNGFKLGNPGGPSVVVNSLAIDNPHNGMDINGSTAAVKVFNSTSLGNARNWRFDQPVSSQVLQNNISYQGNSSDNIAAAVSDTFNSWNGGVTLNNNDFQSLTRIVDGFDLLKGPRQADGSLPDLGSYLKLAADSDLINAGVPISFVFNGVTYNLPFNGSAPDLGAFEFVPAAPPVLLGDFNGDNVVDAADYTVWRNHLGEADESNINHSGDGDGVGPTDYDLWKLHYGQTLEIGSGGIGAAVPEPGTWLLAMMAGLGGMAARRTGRDGRAM